MPIEPGDWVERCTRCLTPNTRPDTHFRDGICSACWSFDARQDVDWSARRRKLEEILDMNRATRPGAEFDCIVPSSGGKDSHWQVKQLLELGAKPLVVTATTCHLTPVGRHNIDNLARYATTIEVTPNQEVRHRLNRAGLELVGDISWPEHVAIFTTPFKIALEMGIPLMFYGECPQEAYGGPPGTEKAVEMTRAWVAEFGGFLGLRPVDLVGMYGLTGADMAPYMPPAADRVAAAGVRAYFLGQFLRWDSRCNVEEAEEMGMQAVLPYDGNWLRGENLDNAQTGIHDQLMFRKYGYGRGCAQISQDVRSGRVSREHALDWVLRHDGLFPYTYMGVRADEIAVSIGLSGASELRRIIDQFAVFPERTSSESLTRPAEWPFQPA
jgi:N-acetyl sugar amidotransferase